MVQDSISKFAIKQIDENIPPQFFKDKKKI